MAASARFTDYTYFIARVVALALQGARRFRVESGTCVGCPSHPVNPDTGDGHDDRRPGRFYCPQRQGREATGPGENGRHIY